MYGLWTKSVGVLSKNVFSTNPPPGITGQFVVLPITPPISFKLCKRTPWMPIQNLCPTFFTWACSSATRRPICAKLPFGQYSYRFCPKITQIGRQYLYSHVIDMDLSDCPYSILIGWDWLSKFVRLVRFGQNASNHKLVYCLFITATDLQYFIMFWTVSRLWYFSQ